MWWTVGGALVALVVTGLLVGPVVARMLTRRASHLADDHRAEVALRVADGTVTGLVGRWRHGVVTFRFGHLKFRGTVGGIRPLRRRALELSVRGIERCPLEVSGWSSAWSLSPGCEVWRVRTTDAVVDVAVPPGGDRVLAMLLEVVDPQEPAEGSGPT